jgi:putative hydrolase of HD superfamily
VWEIPQIDSGHILLVDRDRIIDFIAEAGKLKRLPRTGWVESSVPDPESVADHSFRVALISLILADIRGLDSLMSVRMALIHDLAEAETGDLTPTQKSVSPDAVRQAEEEAIERLITMLPEQIRGLYASTWREFTESITEEARLVRDADKLEMVMQASEYEKEGGDRFKLMRFWHAEINGDDAKAIRDAVKRRSRVRPGNETDRG